ncbi:hypothetical protein [Streptomyces sp. NPDC020571]|uniref:hypothetical protein n=1 Tax=Streptomyces sp. NPDC020571 TaxID=3365079 RepID=UPI0037A4D1D5
MLWHADDNTSAVLDQLDGQTSLVEMYSPPHWPSATCSGPSESHVPRPNVPGGC